MNEEKMRILRLLEEKKISSTDAMGLLEALGKAHSSGGAGGAEEVLRRMATGQSFHVKTNTH